MVVIVIRAQPKDSDEEFNSPRTSYVVENPRQVLESSRCETYDERECFNESWPSPHNSELNASSERKFVNGNQTLCNKNLEGIYCLVGHENLCTSSDSSKVVNGARKNDYRLDSPLSKDSGFCDKITSNRTRKQYKISDLDKYKFSREDHFPSSSMADAVECRDAHNNNLAYLSCSSQVNPDDSVATTKEEEWVTKKKIELTTTRQIETRVKRQVVLEDGKIVEDSGPMVTTNTTEDTEKQEHSQTERRTLGDDNSCDNWGVASISTGRGKEVQEKTVKSREEKEERTETENVQHLGDISDEGYMTAVKSGSNDVRQMLAITEAKNLVETLPRIVHQSMKIKKSIDTEDKTEINQIQPGGKIISERKITTLHEELGDYNVSDDDSAKSASLYETTKKENSQKYRKTKEQNLTEYLSNGQKVGEQLHFEIGTSEGEKHGDDLKLDEEENISSRLRRIQMRSQNNRTFSENKHDELGQHLPKKALALDQEEETRKEETSKWLEHHFGSESTKSSKDSAENIDDLIPSTQNSFINVTMKSQLFKKNLNPKSEENCKKFKSSDRKTGRNFTNNEKIRSFSSCKNDSFQGNNYWASRNDDNKSDDVSKFRANQNLSSFEIFSQDPIFSINQLNSGNIVISTPLNESEHDENLEYVVDSEEKQRRSKNFKPYHLASSTRSDTRDCFCCDNEPGPLLLRQNERDLKSNEECERKIRSTESETKPEKSRISNQNREIDLTSGKKIYQRTRFAADIPPPPPPQTKQVSVKQKSKIGESFRKFVGKLRSSSNDRKNKKRLKGGGSRSPSPKENTYQHYNSLDNYDSLVNRCNEAPEETDSTSKIKQSAYSSYNQPRLPEEEDKLVHRYYLGEDPFSKSIYGREKEYKENLSPRKNVDSGEGDEIDENEDSDFKSRTLGRFSKSTSRLQHSEMRSNTNIKSRGGVQTLPRKFRDEKMNSDQRVNEKKLSKEPFSCAPENWENRGTILDSREPMSHARSLINVSFVNHPSSLAYVSDVRNHVESPWQGPAKPARTYRSNLSRSKSFNVQPSLEIALDSPKPSSHLQGLEESPPPLESPSMIFQWSQSSNCLNEKKNGTATIQGIKHLFSKESHFRAPFNSTNIMHDNVPNEFQKINSDSLIGGSKGRQRADYSGSFRSTSTINTHDSSNSSNDVFQYHHAKPSYLKNSYSPIYIQTFQDGNVIKTVSRSEDSSKNDFSETVRIESKSEDPFNPTETNTVKIFSKKKIPANNGLALETIESEETKTVVTRQGLRDDVDNRRILYNSSPRGVVIKLRNGKTESKHL